MKSWKVGLVVVALLIVILTPAVASARGFWCAGDPVVEINGVRTNIEIDMEYAARDVMVREGKSVRVTIAVPKGFSYRLLKTDQAIPMEVRFRRTNSDDVGVFLKTPNLRHYGKYSAQLTVQVHSRGWSETSGEVRGEAPRARLRVPGDLFDD